MNKIVLAVILSASTLVSVSAFADGDPQYPTDVQTQGTNAKAQVPATDWSGTVDTKAQSVKADPKVQEPADLYRGS